MTELYLLCGGAIILQLGFGILLLRTIKKLRKAMFIKRHGDTVYLEDWNGSVVSEKIILKQRT